MNLVEYPKAYTIRYRKLSIIQLYVSAYALYNPLFLIEYPREIRYIICPLQALYRIPFAIPLRLSYKIPPVSDTL